MKNKFSLGMLKVVYTLFFLIGFHSYSQVTYFEDWALEGTPINGNITNGLLGIFSEMSDDGNTVIVSELGANQVKVYNWSGSSWVQKGATITGEFANDGCGYSISINSNGNIIAVGSIFNSQNGHVRVFYWNGNSWIQKGIDINGESINDYSGYSVSLSSDGNTIAIGAPENDGNGTQSGHTRVFIWNGNSWIQKGSDIDGEASQDHSGVSVSISSDGNTIAIGAEWNDGNGNFSGHTRVFEWNGSIWIQKGPDIDGLQASSLSGEFVSINSTGSIVAIGEQNGSVSGLVRVFEWNGTQWVQRGNNLIGELSGDGLSRVSLNSDGTVLAVGAPWNDNGGIDNGLVKVFLWDGASWIQRGFNINGTSTEGQLGRSLSINSDGTRLVVGIPYNDLDGVDKGQVKIFKLCNNVATVDTQFSCNSFTWIDGITYTQNNNSASVTLTKSDGCDSIVTLNLTILNNTTGTDIITACDNYTWIDGNNYTTSNNSATYNLTNSEGCDSIVTLDLTITNNVNSYFDTVCGGPYYWNNQAYSASGTYTQTLQAANGCDSTVTLNLTVHPTNFNPTFSSSQQLFTAPPFAVQFSNTTVNASNYSFTWFWGDGTSNTTNNSTVFHEYLTNGLYSVTLQATNNQTGCAEDTTYVDYIFTTGGASCTHTAALVQSGPFNACSGQNVVLSCNSSPTFSYQWRKNGVYIQGNNNDTLIVTQPGNYSVIISENGCPVSSNAITVNFSVIQTPIINSSGLIQPCVGGSVTLNTTLGFNSYLWSNGATTSSTNVISSGNYTVQITNANGCAATSAPYSVNASILPTQNICVVGVDSVTTNLRVVWEKPITSAIDSFYIYKESAVANVYTQVGSRYYDSLSVWIDPVSNPAVQAYRYKITALDTCGTETPLSDFHKSIHLTINQSVGGAWNLIWSHYEGLTFGSYNIYRGSDPLNMSLLTTIQSNLNSYTDLTPPVGPVYYQIEIVNPNNCDPTKVINYNVSKSNIVNNGVSSTAENIKNFKVYPNPTDNILYIQSTDFLDNTILIFDAQGRKVLAGKLTGTTTTIDISKLAAGNYLVQVGENKLPVRIVKN
jgi:hypothetical protein